ncbi:ABC transporter permease [Desulfohalobium retbaense]|uniref:Binding-protein-dependent transport systems inner membrane component n=1 Tax=Desulfohalobium retbaense (strain ATCC 49708 / DSM 5692 / JCM 16813 / HR100) TaxID=485915 RepID=C8X5I2_DESRD|nr:ABC transporter permease [Desulfohalobium retbaense]ACV69679.1 binding-protein-dependent transport systems inner membrane component [Desulfohalobium retbaense DSM 5692]
MQFFLDSLRSAFLLIREMDPELLTIVGVSLKVSMSSTALAALFGIPVGFAVAMARFPGRRGVITVFNTLLAVPTVVIGLFVYTFISRRGILGSLDLLYTQKAIIIGQTLLVLPIVATFTISALSRIDTRYRKAALTLGANTWQTAVLVLREARYGIGAAVVAAFGRAIAEIGVAMMLGGNARGFTRTMTTAMALEYDKGEFVLAVALGVVLLSISLAVNIILNLCQGRLEK